MRGELAPLSTGVSPTNPHLSLWTEPRPKEARDFAGGAYCSALFKGSHLSGQEKDALAENITGCAGLEDDLSFTSYPSGHMFCRHEPSLRQFCADAEAWYER